MDMANDILKSDRPPKTLSTEAKRIWRQICDTWDLQASPDALLILKTGLEAYDRLQQARVILDADGPVIKTSTATGSVKMLKHPALESEKTARAGLLQAFRMLGLDLDESTLTGRKG